MERKKLIDQLKAYLNLKESHPELSDTLILNEQECRLFLELLEKEEGKDLQPLFNYMSEEHGLNLLENELHEIVRLVNN